MTENLKEAKPTLIKNLATKSEFAKERGVSLQTVYNWIKDKRLKEVQFMGHKFIDRSTFTEF